MNEQTNEATALHEAAETTEQTAARRVELGPAPKVAPGERSRLLASGSNALVAVTDFYAQAMGLLVARAEQAEANYAQATKIGQVAYEAVGKLTAQLVDSKNDAAVWQVWQRTCESQAKIIRDRDDQLLALRDRCNVLERDLNRRSAKLQEIQRAVDDPSLEPEVSKLRGKIRTILDTFEDP